MKRIVISKHTARMANRLQVYANMIAMACELGAVVYNPPFDDYALLFEGPSRQRG